MKKVLFSALLLCLSAVCILVLSQTAYAAEPAVVVDGTCGDNLTWTLYDNGELRVSGTGEMENYWFTDSADVDMSPWTDYKDSIRKIEVEEGVTSIGVYAFWQCQNLKTVNLSNTVTHLGEGAISVCEQLETVSMPAVTHIGAMCFAGSYMPSIDLPNGLQQIGEAAFSGCYCLEKLVIPESITYIGKGAFHACKSLKEITLPNTLTSIGESVFSDCMALTDITIPNSVKTIGKNAFNLCTGLKTVTIPKGVTEIGEGVFSGCWELQEVKIADSVASIGTYAFAWCWKLKKITFEGDAPVLGEYAFQSITADAYYPANNATWTAGKRQNYGGTINWIPCSTYTVKFLDWDERIIAMDYYRQGEAIVPPADPVRAADGQYTYTFDKWVLKDDDEGPSTPVIPLGQQDLGVCNGNATYIAVYEAKPIQRSVTWVQVTTSLEGNIGLNFYVKLAPSLVNNATTAMRFIFNGVTIEVPLSQAVKIGDQYKFTCLVSAKNMADNVNAQIVTADGPVDDDKNLTVMAYCNYMIGNSNDAKLVNLMKAMLNYGAAAQILFDHNTSNLANASLSAADKVLEDADVSAYAHSVTGSEEGIQVNQATLILETETSIRIYFKLTGSKTIDRYTFKVDGQVVQAKAAGGLYYVEIPNIAAQHLDRMYTITVGGITIRYGGLSYANQVIKNPQYATEAMTNAAKALFAYNKMAEDYFN